MSNGSALMIEATYLMLGTLYRDRPKLWITLVLAVAVNCDAASGFTETFIIDPVVAGRFTQQTSGTESVFRHDPISQSLEAELDVDADTASYLSEELAAPLTDRDTFSFSMRFRVRSVDDRIPPSAFIGLVTTRHVENFGDGLVLNLSSENGLLKGAPNIDNAGVKTGPPQGGASIDLALNAEYVAYARYAADTRIFRVDIFGGSNFVTRAGTTATAPFPLGRTFSVNRLGLQNGGAKQADSTEGKIVLMVDDFATPGRPPVSASVGDVTVEEASGTATFQVILSLPPDLPVSIDYTTIDLSAVAGQDYLTTNGTLTIAAGATLGVIHVPLLADVLTETNEMFALRLSSAQNAHLATTEARAMIRNDDPPRISLEDLSVIEGDAGTRVVETRLSLSNPSALPISFSYRTADGSAAQGADYLSTNGTVSFAAGVTAEAIRISIRGDIVSEGNESFFIELAGVTGATLETNRITVEIRDDDPVPRISVQDARFTEGDNISGNIAFLVKLSRPSAKPISFRFTTVDGTATAGSDYTAASRTVTLNPGEVSASLSVLVRGDLDPEPDENFYVRLTEPLNADLDAALAIGTIQDDDRTPEISIDEGLVVERNPDQNSTLIFLLRLSHATDQIVTVDYASASGTAQSGTDFETASGRLTFDPGVTTQSVSITVRGDAADEGNEQFSVDLLFPVNATLKRNRAVGTIVDNDGVTLQITGMEVREADGAAVQAIFTIGLTGIPTRGVTANFFTQNGTALAGADYTATNGSVSFEPGQLSKLISVDVSGDLQDEPEEFFEMHLASPNGAEITLSNAVARILDNDPAEVRINHLPQIVEGNSGASSARFTVSLSSPSPEEARVDFAVEEDTGIQSPTAVAGVDFSSLTGTLVFPPGVRTQFVDVTILGDTLDEANEIFNVILRNPVNARILTPKGVGTIRDDDEAPTIEVHDVDVVECTDGVSYAEVTITLSAPSGRTVRVPFYTQDDTALAGQDYLTTNGVAEFPPGSTVHTVRVPLICDGRNEGGEGFGFGLGIGDGGNVGGGGFGRIGIADDDPPEITVADATVREENAGTTNAIFVVRLSSPLDQLIAVNFATAPTTATVSEDYAHMSGQLLFPPGTTNGTVRVPVIADLIPEGTEWFKLLLSDAVNAKLSHVEALGTILDDDQPEVQVEDTNVIEGDDQSVTARIAVLLSKPPEQPVTVAYTTRAGTATAGVDFAMTTNILNFALGEIRKEVAVTILPDTSSEAPERIFLSFYNVTNATLAREEILLTIIDNDGTPVLTVADVQALEGNAGRLTPMVFSLRLTKPSQEAIVVTFYTTNGTALSSLDYSPLALTTRTFSPGVTNLTVPVTIFGDVIFEGNEDFYLVLASQSNVALAQTQARGVIRDDDEAPVLSINDAMVNEGSLGTVHAVFAVQLSAAAVQPVLVSFRTVNGTATAGSDFVGTNGTITLAPGMTSTNITVLVLGDREAELDETFIVKLSDSFGALITRPDGNGTISNDDGIALLVGDASVVEGDQGESVISFPLRLARPVAQTVTARYETLPGTATPVLDYVHTTGTVSFPAGFTNQSIEVHIPGDLIDEPDEHFRVRLSVPTNAVLARAEAIGTILDNDPPVIDVSDATVNGSQGTFTQAEFRVTLSTPTSETVTVEFATANATATAGADYSERKGTLLFTPGQTGQNISIAVAGNSLDEKREIFFLRLSNPTNATPGRLEAIGEILNDERINLPPTVQIVAPIPDAFFSAGALIGISAIAQDADGQVTNIQFFAGATLLGSASKEPFTLIWRNATVGGHLLTAIAADNGGLARTSAPVQITVTRQNEPPAISVLTPQSILEDSLANRFPFSVADDTTPLDALSISARSGNELLFATAALVIEGTGAQRTLLASPAQDQFGTAPVTIELRDSDGSSITRTFDIVIQPVNDRPTLSAPADIQIPEDFGVQTISLSGISSGASNESQTLQITVAAADTSIVSSATITYNSPQASGLLTITPVANRFGKTTLAVTVKDDGGTTNGGLNSLTRVINLDITPVNDLPTIGSIPDKSTVIGQAIPAIPFVVNDLETPASQLIVSIASSNPGLLPGANAVVTGSEFTRTLALAPLPGQSGRSTVTLTVRDADGGLAETRFDLEVQSVVNLPPTIQVATPGNWATYSAGTSIIISALAQDPDGQVTNVQFVAGSTLLGVASKEPFTYRWSNAPAGVHLLTAIATDNGGLARTSAPVQITVARQNEPPTISPIADKFAIAGQAIAPISFFVNDLETPPAQLTVSAISSNPSLLPSSSMAFSGTGTQRTLSLSPLGGQSGRATIEVIVRDTDGGQAKTHFTLEVQNVASNLPPTVRLTAPVDASVFSAVSVILLQAEAQDDKGVQKVEFFAGSRKLGEDATAPYTIDWRNPEFGDYVLRAVATDNEGEQSTATARIAVAEVCGTIALIATPSDPELGSIKEYLFELGMSAQVIDRSSLASHSLQNFDLIIWHDFSEKPVLESELLLLQTAAIAGKALYFQGTDLVSKAAGLNNTLREQWFNLIHLQSRGSAGNQAQVIEFAPLDITDWPYLVLSEGKAGFVNNCPYPFSAPQFASTGTAGEFVLATAGGSDVLVAFADLLSGGGERRLTQTFRTASGADPVSLGERKKLFQNAVWWLLRCFHCSNLNLYPNVPEEITAAPGQEFTYLIVIEHSGRCEAIGVSLTTTLADGLELLSAATEKGSWSLADNSLNFTIGRFTANTILNLELTVRATRPGTFISPTILRSTSEVSGALEDNQFTLLASVQGLKLEARRNNTVTVTGSPADARFILEQSADLRNWIPISTNQLVNGLKPFDINSSAKAQYFRAKSP